MTAQSSPGRHRTDSSRRLAQSINAAGRLLLRSSAVTSPDCVRDAPRSVDAASSAEAEPVMTRGSAGRCSGYTAIASAATTATTTSRRTTGRPGRSVTVTFIKLPGAVHPSCTPHEISKDRRGADALPSVSARWTGCHRNLRIGTMRLPWRR